MKSIKQQYIDLREGRMSQHNFMRSVRMSMPQYITNVTSFNDTVKILKNKGILNEATIGINPVESALKSYLAKGYSYSEAIRAVAAEENIDEDILASQFPQDVIDVEGYETDDEDAELEDMIAKAEDELSPEMYKNQDFPGGLSEDDDDEEEAPEDYEDPDMFDAYGMDASEGLKVVKEPNKYAGKWRIVSVDGKKTPLTNKFFDSEDDAKKYGREKIQTSHKIIQLPAETNVYRKIDEGKKKKEKKELNTNQIHPQELRMGIKVELEHTDSLDKAKKIALDHLAENPFYYTALKLAGVDSPSSPKAKYPVAFKKEVAAAVELVDKINAMKPVKGVEKIKASSNKARKETNSGVKGVEELTHNAKSVRGLQKFAATGSKMKTVKEGQLNEAGGEYTFNGTLTADEIKELDRLLGKGKYDFNVEEVDDHYETTISHSFYNELNLKDAIDQVTGRKIAKSSFRPGVDLGKSFDKFKSTLEEIVREVINETFDGRDNLDEDEGFKQWKQALYNIVMEKAVLEASESAIDDEEIKQYYQQGKTPEEVYFNIWQQDAGNFYNVPF